MPSIGSDTRATADVLLERGATVLSPRFLTDTDGGLHFSWGCAEHNMAAGDVGAFNSAC